MTYDKASNLRVDFLLLVVPSGIKLFAMTTVNGIEMSLFIIWATVAFNGEATNLEYQGGLFKTHEKCVEYLTKEESYVLETLNKHINNKYPNGKLLMLACGARSNFEKYKRLDETI